MYLNPYLNYHRPCAQADVKIDEKGRKRVSYKAPPQAKKYTQGELVRAMDLLLRCNQRLVSSGLDEALVMQETLVQIVLPHAVAA